MSNDHVIANDVHDHHDDHDHHDTGGDTIFGFWIYIMSDCILFATLFATYAVLSGGFAGGPTPKELFDLNLVAVGTAFLLFSSFTFGMAMLQANQRKMKGMITWLVITLLLGLGFLGLELYEFWHFSTLGATPQTSGYWSAFYALVATHGLHVFGGIIWMLVLFVHFKRDGFTEDNLVRLSCLSLFWHFLDIIWICVFSVVYLVGVM
ncbi:MULTISPECIES: cytochrome o ubiquinol oxidase subunit III [Pseudoalteromonas]|uniref:Cytochrome bo(3) ubiquinol oxidase subunit 3 n=3 Tax=Pseudoalteromonas TaxID=53246 RepID=A0A167GNG1_9GAMM|nr:MULTISPECIES: cytochrome o ubiquinol oxidase subunit III [Pseudoalteromonas]ESP93155.1 cytochrome o ubiquinol oxidase, subunit III [Pseudoalteromonas luteoviolacea 2ta16]KZN37028.1 cytochrome O ubiquinol oxidase [Pseudoalteromonas luteoviolacea NCIMB 1944]KZN55848.1 cytochrome O ubiquinol oxidase [Pseudoalteromonas luteoviolacea NCIMB 1942]KZX00279.1 cytochrome o ubiquinol oxidase subunit III [Pseudoalteromonas luteoviolacea]MBQ4835861.1 cytochrome o ubiquinol oxidase subunit III [Pseudoalt